MRRLTFKQSLAGGLAAFVVLLIAAAYVWRADIHQSFLDPNVPFQLYEPPPAPDYAKAAAWALLPAQPAASDDPPADVFFIHPTTYAGGRHWNAPLGVEAADRVLNRVMLPNYAGPFQKVGRLFAPRYRQASLYAHLTAREDARDARAFAYRDIEAAFRTYLEHHNNGRPLVIVGVRQGGFLAQRLVRDVVAADRALRGRLVGLYLIDVSVQADFTALAPCTAKGQPGCFVGYLARTAGERDRIDERLRHSLVWRGSEARLFRDDRPVCVNPVTGTLNGASSEREHLGGVNASRLELDTRPAFLAHQVSARCQDGILEVSRPRSASLRRIRGWMEGERARPFNIFYADLEADALGRLESWLETH